MFENTRVSKKYGRFEVPVTSISNSLWQAPSLRSSKQHNMKPITLAHCVFLGFQCSVVNS